jgi:serum/glucocorticoid-regulated kinase 2
MVDWWGLGILIHEMAVGVPPFNNRSNLVVMNDILHEPFVPKDWLSGNLKNLLYLLLEKNPNRRLGADGTASIMSHPFFDRVDWERVENRDYPPPMSPKVKSAGDTKHISKVFLEQEVKNTPTESTIDIQLMKEMHYDNFTYVES